MLLASNHKAEKWKRQLVSSGLEPPGPTFSMAILQGPLPLAHQFLLLRLWLVMLEFAFHDLCLLVFYSYIPPLYLCGLHYR